MEEAGGVARRAVAIPADGATLPGDLESPREPAGVVLFAHGSGSSRLSPRNRQVAARLHQEGLATLLFDLLTDAEAEDRRNVFDVDLLGARLLAATAWLRSEDEPRAIGYFGASTGAAAALWAAAAPANDPSAVVSRGGRPDLAAEHLPAVSAPTLLIVGGFDEAVLELNREAQELLRCESRLEVVPGATHLFEEPGALELVADLAASWFGEHLGARPRTG